MSPKHWRDVSRLFNEALSREADNRAAFLREACADDEPLRKEVESLLAQWPIADSRAPTFAASPRARPRPIDSINQVRFIPGAMLAGRYRIVALLGRGGMGEVYRADDLKLGQPVALKFLPEDLVMGPDHLARLHHEVRVARQVTHPNVCRVYDISEADGQHFLSMEYVERASRPRYCAELDDCHRIRRFS